jgi:uncharacterized protein involved in exopolysaccharide biosynthesis
MGGFSSAIEDISSTLMGRLGNVSEEAFNYLAILQSRTASEKVINKFKLRDIYEIDEDVPFEEVLKELEDNVNFSIEDEGNFIISVTDKSPNRAANMANYYVEILNEINTSLSVTEARSNREFIEKRFIQLQLDIISVEDSLQKFSKKYHVIEMEEQLKAAITVAAEIKAQTELAIIERDLLKASYGRDNPLVKQADLKVEKLSNRLAEMKFGEDKNLKSSLNLFIPFEKIPEIGIQYIRLMRDFEIQNKILEFIYPMYEQAKIEEQKNIPAVLVLDKAIPPEKKSSPKRVIIVLAAFLLSLFFSISYAVINESYKSLQKDEVRYRRIKNDIINPIKNSFRVGKK